VIDASEKCTVSSFGADRFIVPCCTSRGVGGVGAGAGAGIMVVGAAGLFELLSPPHAATTINVPIASAMCAATASRGGKDLLGAG
jgi:hypothetical protein